jgi:hypothetical protein
VIAISTQLPPPQEDVFVYRVPIVGWNVAFTDDVSTDPILSGQMMSAAVWPGGDVYRGYPFD